MVRIALAQLNVTVGDLAGNRRRILEAVRQAQAWLADLVVVPELAVVGYPPEDLLLKPRFVEENLACLRSLIPASHGLTALVGFVDRDRAGKLFNAAAVLAHGRHVATYHKQCLPNYGVFDEARYFHPGAQPTLLDLGGLRVGVTICEDLWDAGPIRTLARAGAQLVMNLSASPYYAGKLAEREAVFARRARDHRLTVAYCNLVGGQDELVFDGASLILDARGRRLAHGAQFREDLVVVDLQRSSLGPARPRRGRAVRIAARPAERPPSRGARSAGRGGRPADRAPLRRRNPEERSGSAEVYDALVLGLRDYVRKNGFSTVVLGLSGGIDSSLTAAIAVDALGPEQVIGVMMPSRYSSPETRRDAKALGRALGLDVKAIDIEPVLHAFQESLAPLFSGCAEDVTEQNLQARVRGMLLMALSNKFGWLVLTTGNKSEMATGYTTLYGDMAGGLAVIKDVPKTLVYELARYRNARACLPRLSAGRRQGPIPETIFTRPPTAELAPNQTDQETLPPYDALDRILKAYVEEDRSVSDILASNRLAPQTVQKVVRMVDRAEYKRRQGPPGIKITPKAFGRDRRMPITNRYEPS